jgi:1-acyl-sn-glycerol-3-phosphate acyltransferase
MRKLPLADQLPYKFFEPRIEPFWLWIGGFYIDRLVRKERKVVAIEIAGAEHLEQLRKRGDGVLITPNHCEHADAGVVFELARRIGWPFYYMAAYQIFTGIGRFGLPRLGVFPVDREGSDLTAFKTAVEILTKAEHPLVVFPEGEIYGQADRLTPLREGAAVVAVTAYKKLAGAGKTMWIVPVGLKYQFLPTEDPVPAFHKTVDDLENRFNWRHRHEMSLADRIYRFAEAMLGIKEIEYLGATRSGPLKERITFMRDRILERIEVKRLGKHQTDPVPVRVKELRHACLEKLSDAKTTPAEAADLRHDLEDLFGAMQLFTYPGDYIRECPTLERVCEILMKLEEDVLGIPMAVPPAARKALVRIGPPIDVKEFAGAGTKTRAAAAALTTALEARIQEELDAIGPGRPICPPADGAPAATTMPASAAELQSSSA